MKWIKFTLACAFVIGTAAFVAVRFGAVEVRRLRGEVDELQQEKERLVEYAQRLSASRRVAQIDVVRQRVDERGRTVSTLLWQEIGAAGTVGKPLALEAVGDLVYFEALVIKFDSHYVAEGDRERGVSLALFRRVFGECQAPESVPELDRAARPPLADTEQHSPLHEELWQRFWDMVDDPQLATDYGVRVAQCEAPAVRLRAGQVWELELDAAGGLNLRQIRGSSSLDGTTSVWLEPTRTTIQSVPPPPR
jgi:hypothetical protein